MSELARVEKWADALIRLHLDPSWSFGFDNAKSRLGKCDYTSKTITISRYLIPMLDDDEVHQTLLHEVAHAIAGSAAGHSKEWMRIARDLGYEGGVRHQSYGATHLAPWVGQCPNGHTVYRHRKPTSVASCSKCSREFDKRFLIAWQHREITVSMRRKARAT